MAVKIKCIGTGSSGNCFLVNLNGFSFLLDCGVKYEEIRKEIRKENIRFCFITHRHYDHCLSAKNLFRDGFKILTGENSLPNVDLFPKILDCENDILFQSYNFLEKKQEYVTMKLFKQVHDEDAPCYGVSIWDDSCAIHYVTDSKDIYGCEKIIGKKNIFLLECNYTENRMEDAENEEDISVAKRDVRTKDTHCGLENFKKFVEKTGYENSFFFAIHTSSLNFDENEFSKKITNVKVLKKNDFIEV